MQKTMDQKKRNKKIMGLEQHGRWLNFLFVGELFLKGTIYSTAKIFSFVTTWKLLLSVAQTKLIYK